MAENKKTKKKNDQERIAELTETLQRLQAEFENFQKRTEKERKEFGKYANKELLLKLIPIVDHLEIALAQEHSGEEFHKGIELIFCQFIETLSKEGLKQIEQNKTFDPEIHEVLMMEESNKPKGAILEVFQKGYSLHGKIIRHAKVKVSK